ncbi:MAG: hypothetical protein ACR2LL_05260 [Nitrosopumilus sp.]
MQRRWNAIGVEFPQYLEKFHEYDSVLINDSMSVVARLNNLKTLYSLSKIVNELGYDWNDISKNQLQAKLMFREEEIFYV